MRTTNWSKYWFVLMGVCMLAVTFPTKAIIPVTGGIFDRADALHNSQSEVVRIEVKGILDYPVAQQPAERPGFVSSVPDEVTQFAAPAQNDVLAFLAHNYLAGDEFSEITENTVVSVTYTDGSTQWFLVEAVEAYQALQPTSLFSDFRSLDTGELFDVQSIYDRVYGGSYPLVMQTCIEFEGNNVWGRLFILAEPLDGNGAVH